MNRILFIKNINEMWAQVISNYNNYTDFITSNYKSFISQLQDSLVKGTQIKESVVKVSFLKKVEGGWQENHVDQIRTYTAQVVPSDDFVLYDMMVKQFNSLPQEARNQPEISNMISLLELPFKSRPVQAALTAFRESVNKELANPFTSLEKNIKEVFDQVLPNEQQIIRILKKEVHIVYSSQDQPTTSYNLLFEKNYAQECASCLAWRTTAHKLSKCGRCLNTYYCNLECQKSDWKEHKLVCSRK